jgi:MOSC domain-containing protein YiiM
VHPAPTDARGVEGAAAAAARVLSLQVGLPRAYGRDDAADPMDRPWTTGYFKAPVDGPVWVGRTNLAGDGQADLVHHGGPDKAVLAYGAAHYAAWREELAPYLVGRDAPGLPFGGFGENLTVAPWTEADVCIGDVHALGEALLEVAQPRGPCWKIARRWRVRDLPARVQRTGRTGWYYRVLREGYVEAGQRLRRLDRPHPEWTVARANVVRYERKADTAEDREITLALAACPALAASLRDTLTRRATLNAHRDDAARLVGPNRG